MRILIYSSDSRRTSEIIQEIVIVGVCDIQFETYGTVKSLSKRLRQPRTDLFMTILASQSQKELSDLLHIHDLLGDVPKILILSDNEQDTVSLAHKFYPRYIADGSGDLTNVALVTKKMFMNACHEKILLKEKSGVKNRSFKKSITRQSNKEGGDIPNV